MNLLHNYILPQAQRYFETFISSYFIPMIAQPFTLFSNSINFYIHYLQRPKQIHPSKHAMIKKRNDEASIWPILTAQAPFDLSIRSTPLITTSNLGQLHPCIHVISLSTMFLFGYEPRAHLNYYRIVRWWCCSGTMCLNWTHSVALCPMSYKCEHFYAPIRSQSVGGNLR